MRRAVSCYCHGCFHSFIWCFVELLINTIEHTVTYSLHDRSFAIGSSFDLLRACVGGLQVPAHGVTLDLCYLTIAVICRGILCPNQECDAGRCDVWGSRFEIESGD
jgi:hypothetical protein